MLGLCGWFACRAGELGTMKRRQRMVYMFKVILGAMKRRGGDQLAYIRNSVQVLREFKLRNPNNTRAAVLFFFASEVRVWGALARVWRAWFWCGRGGQVHACL